MDDEARSQGRYWRQNAAPVSEAPVATLRGWTMIRMPGGTRHFVGWNPDLRKGRITSDVTSFDNATMTATTASGRLYRLLEPNEDDLPIDILLPTCLIGLGLTVDDVDVVSPSPLG